MVNGFRFDSRLFPVLKPPIVRILLLSHRVSRHATVIVAGIDRIGPRRRMASAGLVCFAIRFFAQETFISFDEIFSVVLGSVTGSPETLAHGTNQVLVADFARRFVLQHVQVGRVVGIQSVQESGQLLRGWKFICNYHRFIVRNPVLYKKIMKRDVLERVYYNSSRTRKWGGRLRRTSVERKSMDDLMIG